MDEASPPPLEFAFEASIHVGEAVDLGGTEGTRRRFVPILGGTVTGPTLDAEVLPGGGDWQALHADGRTVIHARYLLRAQDGAVIAVDNPGLRVAAPPIIARLSAGEDVDPALYYFRTTPRFDVRPGPHEWLMRHVFLCRGIRRPHAVILRFFQVL